MDYRPNVDAMLWFGLKVLPRVRRQLDVRLQIVGMDPHPRLNRLRAFPDVELTGAVEDVVPYIQGASVYLDADACGRRHSLQGLGGIGLRAADG